MFHDVSELKGAGFAGFWTVAQLRGLGLATVPDERGVYLALWPDEYYEFVDESPAGQLDGRNPSVSIDVLYEKWVHDTVVIYIGKAGGRDQKATLRTRIDQFLRFGAGVRAPHWGGRYVWQIADCDSMQLCWMSTPRDIPACIEQQLILRFKCDYHGQRPFANLRG